MVYARIKLIRVIGSLTVGIVLWMVSRMHRSVMYWIFTGKHNSWMIVGSFITK